MLKRILVALQVLVAFGILTATAYAQQTTSALSGYVSDSKGAAVSGATITVRHEPTGFTTNTQSNNKGNFYVANLQSGGPYTITISFMGSRIEKRSDYNLSLGTNSLNVKLIEESVSLANVTVNSKRNMALKTGAGIQVGQYQIKNLPSISRSIQDITRLTPQSNNNSFVGTNFRYNNVTLDGAINNDAIGFSPSLGGQTNSSGMPGSSTRSNSISMDAIQDMQVYLAPYDVKIGNFLGGSINAVTRSGTNDFHGSVYGYGRAAFMVGPNSAGDKSKEPTAFHDYQSGFRVGFPIIKNKLFFFSNEEITRRQDPIILAAGSADMTVITRAQAVSIDSVMKNKYGIAAGAGSYDNYNIYSNSTKYFNRLDWVINSKNSLTLRNNTITSEATNLERDGQNFRFGGIDFKQVNNQSSTVAELKSKFSNAVSNSLLLGYSNIHDYRAPLSNPALPQIEISGKGGTIFLGTDREAAIFNMKQKTFEFTDNVTILKGNHTITLGTHNEMYDITYGFVNAWNGRIGYSSVNDFLNNNPNRVRTNFNYSNNTRDYITATPPAQFKINLYSGYGEDEIRIGTKLKITPGIRLDLAQMPNKQPLSAKTTGAPVDPNYGTTYTYTLPKDIKNNFLGQVQISPRIGFNYDVKGDQKFIIRGGSGVFTGRIPFAWLGYAYYNNGVTYGAYDKKFTGTNGNIVAGTDPVKDAISGNNAEANFAANQGANITAAGPTQVDMIDNNFKMPQVWRSSLAFDYTSPSQWKFSIEGIYTKVINDLKFQQVNIVDKPYYMLYDTKHQQPIYDAKAGPNGNGKINSNYTNAYQLSNTSEGYRYSITGQINKAFPFGLNVMAAYTYGQSKDITNGIRNSMESNWQLNQSLTPNNPQLGTSNFDLRHRVVATANYKNDWNTKGAFVSNFTFFFQTSSGLPFSYGLVNSTVDGTPQTNSLMYIPKVGETANFFTDGGAQAAAFDAYIDGNKYLSSRRGQFTERNGGRTPWNTQLDFRFAQDFNFKCGKNVHTLTFTYDIVNLTNLLSSNWGKQYFSPNTFNSTSSLGIAVKTAGTATANPVYTWTDPGAAYVIDYFGSRYQMQAGLRYTF